MVVHTSVVERLVRGPDYPQAQLLPYNGAKERQPMKHQPTSLDFLSGKKPVEKTVGDMLSAKPASRKKIVPTEMGFTIEKKTSVARNKKAIKGLLALLENSPVSKRGGITAEISRDRDRGYA